MPCAFVMSMFKYFKALPSKPGPSKVNESESESEADSLSHGLLPAQDSEEGRVSKLLEKFADHNIVIILWGICDQSLIPENQT